MMSPPLRATPNAVAPVRDAALMAACDQVVVCQIRPHGNVWRLVEQRLEQETQGVQGRTTILAGPGFTTVKTAELLRRRGARVQVVVASEATQSPILRPLGDGESRMGEEAEIIHTPPEYPYLVHCTRAMDGPWPDQNRDDYLDELLFAETDSCRTPLTTLTRIVASQMLLATGRAIRGRYPVVCFTGVPLADLPALRTFRPHRGRWDFEPYGIAIRRDWLVARGTSPVLYGDDVEWEKMDATKRPYFQQRLSGAGKGIDWSIEHEWRYVGALDLRELLADSAFVFVPTMAAAVALRRQSRWPVLVLPT